MTRNTKTLKSNMPGKTKKSSKESHYEKMGKPSEKYIRSFSQIPTSRMSEEDYCLIMDRFFFQLNNIDEKKPQTLIDNISLKYETKDGEVKYSPIVDTDYWVKYDVKARTYYIYHLMARKVSQGKSKNIRLEKWNEEKHGPIIPQTRIKSKKDSSREGAIYPHGHQCLIRWDDGKIEFLKTKSSLVFLWKEDYDIYKTFIK